MRRIVRPVVVLAAWIAAAAGFLLCFGVQLAYLTSHGSAWGSAAGRLRTQWMTGRTLTAVAALAMAGVIAHAIGSERNDGRGWVIAAGVGLVAIFFDVAWIGLTP